MRHGTHDYPLDRPLPRALVERGRCEDCGRPRSGPGPRCAQCSAAYIEPPQAFSCVACGGPLTAIDDIEVRCRRCERHAFFRSQSVAGQIHEGLHAGLSQSQKDQIAERSKNLNLEAFDNAHKATRDAAEKLAERLAVLDRRHALLKNFWDILLGAFIGWGLIRISAFLLGHPFHWW